MGTPRAMVLDALARAIAAGGRSISAEEKLGGDPLLRPAARKRLDRLLAVARARMQRDDADTLRLAFLIESGAADPGTDREAIAARYAEARRPRGARLWWLSATLVAAGAATAVIVPRLHRGRDVGAAAEVAQRKAPKPTGAFATGGTPTAVPGAKDLADALAGAVAALDAVAQGDPDGANGFVRARDRVVETAKPLGPAAAAGVLEVVDDARVATGGAADRGPLVARFFEAVGALDDELAAAGLGLYVDADFLGARGGPPRLLLMVSAVERVALYEAGALEVRALRLRRVGADGDRDAGRARPSLQPALLFAENLEDRALNSIAPALAANAPLHLVEAVDPAADFPERAAVEARAGEIVRDELAALPGVDVAAAGRFGAALAHRRAVLEHQAAILAPKGFRLGLPRTLRLPPGWRERLTGAIPAPVLDELATIDAELGSDATARTLASLVDAYGVSVERHEVQHRLDAVAKLAVMPEPLRVLRPDPRARDELSGYLAEIARDPATPRTNLSLLARWLLDPARWGQPDSLAALVIFEALGRELAIPAKPILVERRIDLSAAAALYTALAAQPPDKLRAAAGQAWTKLFGAPLAPLTRRAP